MQNCNSKTNVIQNCIAYIKANFLISKLKIMIFFILLLGNLICLSSPFKIDFVNLPTHRLSFYTFVNPFGIWNQAKMAV